MVVHGFTFYIQAREFLSGLGDLSQTQIFAKIENVEVKSSFWSIPKKFLHMQLHWS